MKQINESHDSVMKGIRQSNQDDLNKTVEGITHALEILDLAIGSREIEDVPMIEDKILDARDALLNALPSTHAFNESRKRFGNKFVARETREPDDSRWSEYGELLTPLPMECILDCSHGGRCDSDVEYWSEQLAFSDGLPIEMAKKYLSEFGAWDRKELDEMDDEEIAQRVLWIFCGNIKDEAYEKTRDPDSEYPEDIDDWDERDWRRFQEEDYVAALSN